MNALTIFAIAALCVSAVAVADRALAWITGVL